MSKESSGKGLSTGAVSSNGKQPQPQQRARDQKSAVAAAGYQRTVLSDFLTLYAYKQEEPFSIRYEVENTSLRPVEFVLSLEGSENFRAISSSATAPPTASAPASSAELQLVSTFSPFLRNALGRVELIDDERRATLKVNCSWSIVAPNETELEEAMHLSRLRVMQSVQQAERVRFPSIIEDPSGQETLAIFAKSHVKFVDREFKPNELCLYPKLTTTDGRHFFTADGIPFEKTLKHVEFRRPDEFFNGQEHAVFEDSIAAEDIRQGSLGDCWFLSALAAMTEFPQLIRDIFVDEWVGEGTSSALHNAGAYTLRFCKNGMWTNVRIDDYFPCFPGAGPIFSRSHGNELWVLLVEKAFAKIHGNYTALRAGYVFEALMDLTGAPCKTFHFDDDMIKAQIQSGNLWKDLVLYDSKQYLLCVSTPGEDDESVDRLRRKDSNGLIAGHAYTLISCKNVGSHRLCKLRNPWGHVEWQGDWSDSSSLWTPQILEQLGEKLDQQDDGTFWMSFDDVVKHFFSLNVCFVRHPAYSSQPWKEQRRKFFFDYQRIDTSEEDAPSTTVSTHAQHEDLSTKTQSFRITSPLYTLHVQEKGTFICTLHQRDTRCEGSPSYIDTGLAILRMDPHYHTFRLVAGVGNTCERQNLTEEVHLDAGKYLVVPFTSGAKLRSEVELWLNAEQSREEESATSNNNNNSNNTSNINANTGASNTKKPKVPLIRKDSTTGEIKFTDHVVNAYQVLFARLDADCDGVLNKMELDQYMLRTEGSTIEDAAFAWLLHNFESKEAPGLSMAGFINAQLYVFRSTGSDEAKLWDEFTALGFDESLQLRTGRGVSLSVHGTSPFSIQNIPFDEQAAQEAQELVIMELGEKQSFDEQRIHLFSYRPGYHGVSLMVENCHHLPLVFSLDCTESDNVVSHRGDLAHTEIVPPNQRVIFHHLSPKNIRQSWAWGYNASFMWDEEQGVDAEATP